MELVKDGKLSELIASKQAKSKCSKRANRAEESFTDRQASQIMRCILSGIDYVHNMNIVHRDLKPDNILVGDLNNLSTVKIADFGLSAKYNN